MQKYYITFCPFDECPTWGTGRITSRTQKQSWCNTIAEAQTRIENHVMYGEHHKMEAPAVKAKKLREMMHIGVLEVDATGNTVKRRFLRNLLSKSIDA